MINALGCGQRLPGDMTAPVGSEVVSAPRLDLPYLRLMSPALDAFAGDIQAAAAKSAAVSLRECGLHSALPQRVLVSGSSGYLGVALVSALRELGVSTVGVDRLGGPTTDVLGDICDEQLVRGAAEGCLGVLHTAALHAPNATQFSEEEFFAVNVAGTANMLAASREAGAHAFVHTSTTSLTMTAEVKAAEARGGCVWIGLGDDSAEYNRETPRNKYGRSKLEAERLCHKSAAASDGPTIIVVRAPRFFPEDAFDSDLLEKAKTLQADGGGAGLKAMELLGVRAALGDLVDAHLRALAKAAGAAVPRFSLYTLVPPLPLEQHEVAGLADSAEAVASLVHERLPRAAALFASYGWRPLTRVAKLSDGSRACAGADAGGLGWRPRWTFETLLQALAGELGDEVREDAGLGRY